MQDGIVALASIDLRLKPGPWPFAEAEGGRIARHWREVVALKPSLWNGRILMCTDIALAAGHLSARFFETDYASFVAWRDWGWPDRTVSNCFGSAVIVSSDRALLYGRMAALTLNPGMVYPPGGSLEPHDVLPDGRVDMGGSIARELKEETGLDVAGAAAGPLLAVFDGGRLSLAQVLSFEEDAATIASLIDRHIAGEDKPELDGVVTLRSASDIAPSMPGYAVQIARFLLTERAPG